jgi:dimethylhistidine N-methyltransferase
MSAAQHGASLQHADPVPQDFLQAVLAGLSRPQKFLPSRYFYDAEGSALFEQITELPEYYLTRVELDLLQDHADRIANGLPAHGVLVEFGSGSSTKTELILRQLPSQICYAPIDVSHAALEDARNRLEQRFPDLAIRPVVSDFFELAHLPGHLRHRPKLGFFPGSTIGNYPPAEASQLLTKFRRLLAPNGRLIVGVDLKKDVATLERAYNDSAGVTARFNLNLLARINRDIAPVIDIDAFEHGAFYNPREGRIEMHLVSRRDQRFEIAGRRFALKTGETIHTENSYKYAIPQFQELARAAGWTPSNVWTDRDGFFSIHELA